jgi:hypothetical protein
VTHEAGLAQWYDTEGRCICGRVLCIALQSEFETQPLADRLELAATRIAAVSGQRKNANTAQRSVRATHVGCEIHSSVPDAAEAAEVLVGLQRNAFLDLEAAGTALQTQVLRSEREFGAAAAADTAISASADADDTQAEGEGRGGGVVPTCRSSSSGSGTSCCRPAADKW